MWSSGVTVTSLLNGGMLMVESADTVNSPGLRDVTFRPLTAGLTATYKF
jgi:hypothetical protein